MPGYFYLSLKSNAMTTKRLLFIALLSVTITTQAQKNFTYSPEKPKPGEVITFTYEPAGDLANTIKPVEGVVYQVGKRGNKADDIVMERKAGKYTGTITTDTAMGFIYLGFKVDKKFDNNFNEGYYIQLFENDKPRDGSYFSKSGFYQFMGRNVGLDQNNEKALEAIEKEIELYPENKKTYLFTLVRLQTLIKKDDAQKIVQKEIESILKAGLKEETDYSNLENPAATPRWAISANSWSTSYQSCSGAVCPRRNMLVAPCGKISTSIPFQYHRGLGDTAHALPRETRGRLCTSSRPLHFEPAPRREAKFQNPPTLANSTSQLCRCTAAPQGKSSAASARAFPRSPGGAA